ncbi:MAG: hypothetical protein QOD84_2089 [Acidobacteriaceae bacterium]
MWAQTFEVSADNAFTLEDSIAERVVSNRYFAANYYTEDGYRKALHYLQNAIDDDPAYALAFRLPYWRTATCSEQTLHRKRLRLRQLFARPNFVKRSHSTPRSFPTTVILCWALDAKGDTKAALDSCKQALERQASPWTALALARAQAVAGDHAAAAATMASVRRSEQFVSGYDPGAVYTALGRTDDAFAALEECYQSRAEWMSYLKVDPQMDTLRRDPRYTTLLKRINL